MKNQFLLLFTFCVNILFAQNTTVDNLTARTAVKSPLFKIGSTDTAASRSELAALTSTLQQRLLGNGFVKSTNGVITYETPTITNLPTPFNLGGVAVNTTAQRFNYLASAAGTTGTTSTNLVFSTSPTIITPTINSISATNFTIKQNNVNTIYSTSSGAKVNTLTLNLGKVGISMLNPDSTLSVNGGMSVNGGIKANAVESNHIKIIDSCNIKNLQVSYPLFLSYFIYYFKYWRYNSWYY